MADITVSINFSIVKGEFALDKSLTYQASCVDESFDGPIVSIGTSEEDITFHADLGTPGVIFMKNLGTTDVRYGPKSAGAMVPMSRILPGETAHFRMDSGSVVIRALSVTTANKVQFWAKGV